MRSFLSRYRTVWFPSPLKCAGLLAVLMFWLVPADLGIKTRFLAGWTVGVAYLLLKLLSLMRTATADQTRDLAQQQQAGSSVVVALIGVVSCISFFAIGFLLSTAKTMPPQIQILHVGLAALALGGAWFLIHTTFAQQYAALYYRPTQEDMETPWAGGLLFQKQEMPNYWDFLYFAFVIGATAQTSDTFILSRPVRRLALIHALISFLFFVGIVAMCVNVGSAFLQSNDVMGGVLQDPIMVVRSHSLNNIS